MDSFISTTLNHFQPVLVLIAIALSLVTMLTNKGNSAAAMRKALGYFILFPVTVFAVWQCASLLFFPEAAAVLSQTLVTPYETLAGLFFLALAAFGVMALLGKPGMTRAVILVTTFVCWGTFLTAMTGTGVISGSSSILQTICNLALPTFMIVFNRLSKAKTVETA